MKKNVCIFVFTLFLVSCSTVPFTGRSALSMVSNKHIFPMSFSQYGDVLKSQPLSKDVRQTRVVKNVGGRLQKAVENYFRQNGNLAYLQDYKWEFNLIEGKQVNAWCMPGGKVAFYTGIMPVCEGERGVAVVMGHEIAHALANHGAERMSQQMLVMMGAATGGIAIKDKEMKQAFSLLYPIGTSLTVLSYSRKQELEADRMGLIIMAMAGYDPREAPYFWNRMQKASGGSSKLSFLSTHPSSQRRVEDLRMHMPEALNYYTKAMGINKKDLPAYH